MGILSKIGNKKRGGHVETPHEFAPQEQVKTVAPHISVCRKCKGTGRDGVDVCMQCRGSGRVIVSCEVRTFVSAYVPEEE